MAPLHVSDEPDAAAITRAALHRHIGALAAEWAAAGPVAVPARLSWS